ncbi:MAG: hypothetical protein WKF59_11865 [Chitinophagaceae bacterium]
MQYEEFRKAGHTLIDYIADYLQEAKNNPLFQEVEPAFLNDLFNELHP